MKWHGAGNDFIITTREAVENANISDLGKLAAAVCHRRFGIGADGLMVVDASALADIKMTYYNSDGSYAAMCGNGIRCFSAFCHHQKIVHKPTFTVETGDGIKMVTLTANEGYQVQVDMGVAQLMPSDVPTTLKSDSEALVHLEIDSETFTLDILKVGVPHTVVDLAVEQIGQINFETFGPRIEHHSGFPERTNVNFVYKLSENALRVDTWERGAGLTYACGTGVCASAFSFWRRGLVSLPVSVEVTGGTLRIDIIENHIFMTGPAVMIAEGVWHN